MSFAVRAIMYPNSLNATNQEHDNSPVFVQPPRTIISKGTNELVYHAIDPDGDSLEYFWGIPYQGSNYPISTFANGYSFSNPLPDSSINPNNVAAQLDARTGIINTTVYTEGAYYFVVGVKSYRNGILLSENYRESYLLVDNSLSTNTAPVFTPQSIDTTIFVGDSLDINLSVSDFEYLPLGNPQTINWQILGQELGNYIPASANSQAHLDTLGCIKAPCATLMPAHAPDSFLSGQFGLATSFKWRTDCNHMYNSGGMYSFSRDYHFILYAEDDYCPTPHSSSKYISVRIKDRKPLNNVDSFWVNYDYYTYNCQLNWTKVADPYNQFVSYNIYHADSLFGSQTLIDSITDINTTQSNFSSGLINEALFIIKVISRNHCLNHMISPDIAQVNLQQTGINDKEEYGFRLISCQPNPAKESTAILFKAPKAGELTYRLIDSHGRMLEQRKVHANLGENHITQATQNLEAGIYFYSLEWKGVQKTGRIVVLK